MHIYTILLINMCERHKYIDQNQFKNKILVARSISEGRVDQKQILNFVRPNHKRSNKQQLANA